jgi:hypothetical protein
MKNPRFEIHFIEEQYDEQVEGYKIPSHYQWFLKHSNRKTLAMGRPKGFRSIKGCLDALAKVEQVLNPEKHFTVEEKIFYKDCK